jgi:hypothetical protein
MILSTGMRSSARRASGPSESILVTSPSAAGKCPELGTTQAEHLCPNTPLKNAGRRIEPPMSLPRPIGDPPDPTAAPSPPDDPPATRDAS